MGTCRGGGLFGRKGGFSRSGRSGAARSRSGFKMSFVAASLIAGSLAIGPPAAATHRPPTDLTVTKPTNGLISGGNTDTPEELGIWCGDTSNIGNDCTQSFSSNCQVDSEGIENCDYGTATLTASPASGWSLGSWGGACAETVGNVCYLSMHLDRSVSATFVDIGAPTVSVNNANSWVRGTTASLSAMASDAGAGVSSVQFQYLSGPSSWTTIATDNSAVGGWSVSWNTTSLASGPYQVRAIATDGASNQTTSTAVQIGIDNIAPEVSIVAPEDWARGQIDVVANASDFGSGVSQLEFSYTDDPVGGPTQWTTLGVDSEGPTWTVPWDTTAVSEGPWRVEVVAVDRVGNYQFSQEQVVVVDNTAPDTTITAGPESRTSRRRATFQFTSTQADSTFRCRLDDRRWRPCTSPKTYRNLQNGRHTFRVRATDPAGNLDSTPAVRTWRVV